MRTHTMYELLGTLWWMAAILGVTEGMNKVMYVAGIIGTHYFMRAFMKWYNEL